MKAIKTYGIASKNDGGEVTVPVFAVLPLWLAEQIREQAYHRDTGQGQVIQEALLRAGYRKPERKECAK